MPAFFNGHGSAAFGIPADDLPVTPSDTEDLPKIAHAIYCAGGGTIVYDTLEGESREREVPDHFTFFCAVRRVRATGTTATGIVASVF
ncbi:MAG: hypothetical protein VYD87_19875 [Pseudomonadota bacterium]|nr:hypothetical protein [Pseudomonadota bacterium]MEE3101095.1 hypothetical protein [Pseudomonadota bacterium]